MTDGSLAERMADAARELQEQHDPRTTLDRAVHLAVANIEGADAAGISIVHARERIDTEAVTDAMATRGDELQYETGEGPCLDAIWEEQTTYSPCLADDRRWPQWGPRVSEETGAQSVLAFQLFTTGDTVGALNLYSRTHDGFDDTDREEGLAIAAHIAIAVAGAKEIEMLSDSRDTRTVIGKALGILMERFDLADDDALALLIRLTSAGNAKLRDVAAEIAQTRRLPGETPGRLRLIPSNDTR